MASRSHLIKQDLAFIILVAGVGFEGERGAAILRLHSQIRDNGGLQKQAENVWLYYMYADASHFSGSPLLLRLLYYDLIPVRISTVSDSSHSFHETCH